MKHFPQPHTTEVTLRDKPGGLIGIAREWIGHIASIVIVAGIVWCVSSIAQSSAVLATMVEHWWKAETGGG